MSILIKPIITEKATNDSENNSCYAFAVNKKANKLEIKQAVQELYGVNVEEIKTMIIPGKHKMRYIKRGTMSGNTGSYKKAIVKVRSGETVDLRSNI